MARTSLACTVLYLSIPVSAHFCHLTTTTTTTTPVLCLPERDFAMANRRAGAEEAGQDLLLHM